MKHVNPDDMILDLLRQAFGEPVENQAAYDHFEAATQHIWSNRPLTTQECEEYAAKTAEAFGLDWKWVDGSGLNFTAKAN